MKILLVIVYASLLPIPESPKVHFSTYEFTDKAECNAAAREMVRRVPTGQLRAFCLKVRDKS